MLYQLSKATTRIRLKRQKAVPQHCWLWSLAFLAAFTLKVSEQSEKHGQNTIAGGFIDTKIPLRSYLPRKTNYLSLFVSLLSCFISNTIDRIYKTMHFL